MQLLTLRAQDISVLPAWLNHKTNFLFPESQNELLELFAHRIQRNIVKIINETAVQFAVVVDGKQDNTGTEQESIFVRYVDADLCPNEVFLGLYSPPDTSGHTLSTVIKDVLTRRMLPISNLR